jgi:glycosyltransferase involved in cell wall biosynthesis
MAYVDNGDDKHVPIDVRRDFMAWRLREVDAVISPSTYLGRAYVRAGLPVSKIREIWYGIDVERLSKVVKTPSIGKVRFTFIGYFGAHKGIWPLLEAASQLGQREDYSLAMVGTGDLVETAQAFVRDRGLERSVALLGKVEHRRIGEVFSNTDVFVLPSIWPENQPVTIGEAMATRTAVVASDIGGIPEMVSDGVTGYLVPPNSVGDLAARMVDLIDNPERAVLLGKAGFDRIRDDTVEHQVAKILAVYDE